MVIYSLSVRQYMDVGTFRPKLTIALEYVRKRVNVGILSPLTFAKYLHTLSVVLERS